MAQALSGESASTQVSDPLGRVAITGASGFIGRHLVRKLDLAGTPIRLLSRHARRGAVEVDFEDQATLTAAFQGVDTVFHCAGRAHAFAESEDAELHRRSNELAPLAAARAAAAVGVRQFVFLSSVKAVGEPGSTCIDEHFDAPAETAYGNAKRQAELGLMEIGAATQLHPVILRLAMVYGPGGRGNLERMMRMVEAGWFPPLPETGNHRSLVHVDDVVDALLLAARHPMAVGRTYIVAHPVPVSGRTLFNTMCEVLGRQIPSFEVPAWLLRSAGKVGDVAGGLIRRRLPLDSQSVSRLLDSAWYSSARLNSELAWQPKLDLREGLQTLVAETHSG